MDEAPPEGLFRVTGCRACDEGRYLCEEHKSDCFHERRDEDRGYFGRFEPVLCLDCGEFVALIGEEDEEGHPTWAIP